MFSPLLPQGRGNVFCDLQVIPSSIKAFEEPVEANLYLSRWPWESDEA
jgi:hypothetical protein